MEDSNSTVTGSTELDDGTALTAAAVHRTHIHRGMKDPTPMALLILFLSPLRRLVTKGIVSLYTRSCSNTGTAQGIVPETIGGSNEAQAARDSLEESPTYIANRRRDENDANIIPVRTLFTRSANPTPSNP